jgi:hypothetical protein
LRDSQLIFSPTWQFTFTKSKEYELVGKVKQGAPLKEFDKVFEMMHMYDVMNTAHAFD